MQKHTKTGAWATLSLCKVEDPSRYGVAETTKNGKITQFTEKPPKGTETSNLINAGVYVLSPQVLQLIPKDKAVSMEREIFPKLASRRKTLRPHRSQFVDGHRQTRRIHANKPNPPRHTQAHAKTKRQRQGYREQPSCPRQRRIHRRQTQSSDHTQSSAKTSPSAKT